MKTFLTLIHLSAIPRQCSNGLNLPHYAKMEVEDALALEVPVFDRNDLWLERLDQTSEEARADLLAQLDAIHLESSAPQPVVRLLVLDGSTACTVFEAIANAAGREPIQFARLILPKPHAAIQVVRLPLDTTVAVLSAHGGVPLDLANRCARVLLEAFRPVDVDIFTDLSEAQSKVWGEQIVLRVLQTEAAADVESDQPVMLSTPTLLTGLSAALLAKSEAESRIARAHIVSRTALSERETQLALVAPITNVLQLEAIRAQVDAIISANIKTDLRAIEPKALFA